MRNGLLPPHDPLLSSAPPLKVGDERLVSSPARSTRRGTLERAEGVSWVGGVEAAEAGWTELLLPTVKQDRREQRTNHTPHAVTFSPSPSMWSRSQRPELPYPSPAPLRSKHVLLRLKGARFPATRRFEEGMGGV